MNDTGNSPRGIWVKSTDNSSIWSGDKPVYNFNTDNITYESYQSSNLAVSEAKKRAIKWENTKVDNERFK